MSSCLAISNVVSLHKFLSFLYLVFLTKRGYFCFNFAPLIVKVLREVSLESFGIRFEHLNACFLALFLDVVTDKAWHQNLVILSACFIDVDGWAEIEVLRDFRHE